MPNYQVIVNLDNETLQALSNGRFQMQAYKGVKTASAGGALPTVWFTLDKFSSTLKVSWSESFGGYFSDTPVKQGVQVDISTQSAMSPGDVITLNQDGSSSVSTTGGIPDTYAFKSEKNETWTCGLLTAANSDAPTPICAFPQYGAVGNLIEPYQKVLLLFTQKQLDTGAVVQTAVSKSISIIMSPSETSIQVGFNINTGWDTGGNPQAKQNPANFEMAPDLIIPSATLTNIQTEERRLVENI